MKKQTKILLSMLCITLVTTRVAHVSAAEIASEASAHLMATETITDNRIDTLRRFLVFHNSPMIDSADHFVSEADRLGLDWKLVAAIAGTESTFGKRVPKNSYNAWGWGIPTGAQSGIVFTDWNDGITKVSVGLKTRYIDRGATSIEQIGRIYAASPRWAGNVRFFMQKIDAFNPIDPEYLSIDL